MMLLIGVDAWSGEYCLLLEKLAAAFFFSIFLFERQRGRERVGELLDPRGQLVRGLLSIWRIGAGLANDSARPMVERSLIQVDCMDASWPSRLGVEYLGAQAGRRKNEHLIAASE